MHKRKDNRAVKLRPRSFAGSAESAQDEADVPETEPVTIHLFHQKQEAQDAFTQIIDAFHKEYPTINVEQEIVTNEPAAILKARLATNEIPDIFQGSTTPWTSRRAAISWISPVKRF